MHPGVRVRLFGGYDPDPAWLAGQDEVRGTVTALIPGQNAEPACVVQLDEPITAAGLRGGRRALTTGDVLVLELRHVGAEWSTRGTVHVELCDFDPESRAWGDRRQGVWVESHAEFEVEG